jgi:hypothetical protein
VFAVDLAVCGAVHEGGATGGYYASYPAETDGGHVDGDVGHGGCGIVGEVGMLGIGDLGWGKGVK